MEHSDYVWVDTAFGGVDKRNRPVRVGELKLPMNPVDCYRTFFRYPGEFMEYFKRNVSEKTGKPSVGGYSGFAYADYFPIDVDNEDLSVSLDVTRGLLRRMLDEGLNVQSMPIFFSGRKGFHIYVPSVMFGCFPSRDISQVFKRFAKLLLGEWGLKYDSTIYDTVRLLRLSNTVNSGSGLYKVQLDVNELWSCGVEEIRMLAMKPRERVSVMEAKPTEFLLTLYRNAMDSVVKGVHVSGVSLDGGVMCPRGSKVCYHQMLRGVGKGNRNVVAYRLACHFLKQGYAMELTEGLLLAWDRKNDPPMGDERVREKLRSAYDEKARNDYGCNDEVLRGFCHESCYLRGRKQEELSVSFIKTFDESALEYERYMASLSERMCVLDIPVIGQAMRGISPGEVCTILGATGVGKTAMMLNFLMRIGIANKMSQLFFTLEQPTAQIYERMAQIASNLSGSQVEAIYRGQKNGEWSVSRVKETARAMFERVLLVDKDFLTVEQMIELVRRAEQEKVGKKIGVVAVDYLGRMKGSGRDMYAVLSENAQAIKHMAKELDVAVLVLAQVNRSGGDGTEDIGLRSARDSGQIEEASDFVIGVWRPEMHANRDSVEDKIRIRLLKNRKGPAPVTRDLRLVKRVLRIDDYEQPLWMDDEPLCKGETWHDRY